MTVPRGRRFSFARTWLLLSRYRTPSASTIALSVPAIRLPALASVKRKPMEQPGRRGRSRMGARHPRRSENDKNADTQATRDRGLLGGFKLVRNLVASQAPSAHNIIG